MLIVNGSTTKYVLFPITFIPVDIQKLLFVIFWYLLYFVICYLISLASHVSILEYDEVWILNVEYYIFLIYFYLTAHNSEKKILLVVQKKPLTNKKISFAGLNSWKKSFKRRCNIQYSKFKLRHIPKLTMIWQRY